MKISQEEVEAMLRECVPGGNNCDPQKVADSIREYFEAVNQDKASNKTESKPKLRAWKPEEVPIYALLRVPYNNLIHVIIGVHSNNALHEPEMVLAAPNGSYYPGNRYFLADAITSLEKPEHSIDGGKTWHPCGVIE